MTLNTIKSALFAAMHGMTPAEYELQKARDNLKSVTDDFLTKHPEALKTKSTPNLKTGKTIIKMLGAEAGVFKPHDIDPDALERAKAACRKLVADNPDRYGNIIKQQGAE